MKKKIAISTSYFAMSRKIENPTISICARKPFWFKGPEYLNLAPKLSFLRKYKEGKIDDKEYTRLFSLLVLSNLNAFSVLKDICSFYPDASEITLLCYEKADSFCHRHLVANWLSTKLDIKVEEKRF